ncbi:MAG: septum formation initiator family protein [Streptococcaceae bacterium]|nr:septum formation initiator family protein [Streptococcaceae bacterium]MCL2858124.1 septum formation initiator family protein [Streptococcaceae bacterium]
MDPYHTNNYPNRSTTLPQKTKNRRHLGIILIFAILLFTIAGMSLVGSFKGLESNINTRNQAQQQDADLNTAIALKNAEIKKLSDPSFFAKYARGAFSFSQPDEKVFLAPGLNGSVSP